MASDAVTGEPDGPVVIELAGEPKGKGRARSRIVQARGDQQFVSHYTPAKTRSYEAALTFAAQQVMDGRVPFSCAVTVKVMALFSIPASWSRAKRARALAGEIRHTSKPDWENIAKTLDAFNGVVWSDDRLVDVGLIVKRYAERPALCIEVKPSVP